MANGEFLEVLSPSALKDLEALNAELVKTVSNVKAVNQNMISIKTPSGSDSAIKDLNAKLAQQEALYAKLQSQLQQYAQQQARTNAVVNQSTSATVRNTVASRDQAVANQIARAETDRNFRANTLLAGAYARSSAQLLILKKELKDAVIMHGEQSKQAIRAGEAYKELNIRIRTADETAGDFQRNVGNYSGGIAKGFAGAFSSLRQLAYLLPGIGIAGILGMISESVVKVFTNSNEALNKFKENITDVASTATEKSVTLKVISQVLNDTKTSQEQYANALKLAKQEGISLNAIEQARSGNLALINEELTKQIDISIAKAKADKLVNLIAENEIEQTKNLRKEKEDYYSWYRRTLRAVGKVSSDAVLLEASINKSSISNIKELKRENTELYDLLKKLGLENLLDDKEKAKSNALKKIRTKLTFDEVESEYALRLAILERQKAEIADRMNNDSASLEAKVRARQEYSDKSIEILSAQTEKEKAISNQKYLDDLTKNDLALKNKELTQEEYEKNVIDISYRYANEQEKIDVDSSNKFNSLLNEDLAFYKKIELEKRNFSEKTEKMISEASQKRLKKIADDENTATRKTLTLRQLAFEEYQRLARKQLDIDKIRELSNAKSDEEIDNIIQKYKDLNEELSNVKSPYVKAREEFQSYLNTISNGALGNALDRIGLSSLKLFTDIDKNGQTTFDKLIEGAESAGEKIALVFQTVGDVYQDVTNKIAQISQANFEAENERNKQQTEIAVAFANGNEDAIAEIQRQSEARRVAIAKKQAKEKKDLAKFNIIIDTAQAIVAFLAQGNIAGSIYAGIIGAIELALVNSQNIPAFWEGGTHEKGGLMVMNDDPYGRKGGNYKEVALTPAGTVFKPQGTTVVANMPKGTEVFKNYAEFDQFMFDKQLGSIMNDNGISNPVIVQNNTTALNNEQVGRIVEAVRNIPVAENIWQDGEVRNFIRKNGVREEIQNARNKVIIRSV